MDFTITLTNSEGVVLSQQFIKISEEWQDDQEDFYQILDDEFCNLAHAQQIGEDLLTDMKLAYETKK